MSILDERIVASLRSHHDQLAVLVESLDQDALTGSSGAAEWRVCDVLSHLGSGAEITLHAFRAALDDSSAGTADNQAVWDRWNAMSPSDQAASYVEHDAALVGMLEGLSASQRDALGVDLGFGPQPVAFEVAAGMRLNEVAQHAWDVRIGHDPAATLDAAAADILLELYAGSLSFLLGFTAHADELTAPTEVKAGTWALVVDDGVRVVSAGSAPLATFAGAPEAFVRLLGGRLTSEHTPAGVEVSGSVSLDDLRRVFPGF